MNTENFSIYDGVEVAPSAILKPIRNTGYGSLADLPDDELASPDELERQVLREQFAPVLLLPVKKHKGGFRHYSYGDDEIGFDAFGTVDFDRTQPEFDKARYKADRLNEKLSDVLILLAIVKERLPGKAKYGVLKYLEKGIIKVGDIVNPDVAAFARLYLRARGIQKEIAQIKEASKARKEKALEAFLKS